MTRRSALPQSPHHLMVYNEDWDFLLSRFGPKGIRPEVGVGPLIRGLIHQKVRELKAREQMANDQESPSGSLQMEEINEC